jgi:hypothetical protein
MTTCGYLRRIGLYHRQKEARHLVCRHHRRRALPIDRAGRPIRRTVARAGHDRVFDTMVQQFVYPTIGLPAWKTWTAVRRSPNRIALRRQAWRAVLRALLDSGVFRPGHVPSCRARKLGSAL